MIYHYKRQEQVNNGTVIYGDVPSRVVVKGVELRASLVPFTYIDISQHVQSNELLVAVNHTSPLVLSLPTWGSPPRNICGRG